MFNRFARASLMERKGSGTWCNKYESKQACSRCGKHSSTVPCPSPSWNCVIRELKQPPPRRQQERHEFAYLTMKNNRFASFARAFFIFGHFADVLVLSWHEMSCFAVVWTTWAYDDKCSILSSYLWSAGSNLIAGYLEHILQAWLLWIIEEWLQKCEITFPDDVLAVVDVVFAEAPYLNFWQQRIRCIY